MRFRHRSRNVQSATALICSLALVMLSVGQTGCRLSLQSCDCDIKTSALVNEPDVPIVAIYRVTAGMRARISPEEMEPQIILAAWADGRVIWSGDETQGGRPYYQGSTAPRRLDAFFAELARKGVSGERLQRRSHFGPDSDYLGISICRGSYSLRLESWHELFEIRPTAVATAAGISALGDKSREQVLAEQPEDYRRFRELWSVIRDAAEQLVPDEELPTEGLHFERRAYQPD